MELSLDQGCIKLTIPPGIISSWSKQYTPLHLILCSYSVSNKVVIFFNVLVPKCNQYTSIPTLNIDSKVTFQEKRIFSFESRYCQTSTSHELKKLLMYLLLTKLTRLPIGKFKKKIFC